MYKNIIKFKFIHKKIHLLRDEFEDLPGLEPRTSDYKTEILPIKL